MSGAHWSMRDYGYRPEFPVLLDKLGRVLDGRHRLAAAKRAEVTAPTKILPIESDEEALGFAILVNLQRGWTKAERGRIDSDLRAAGLTVENFGQALGTSARRERIRVALLENPQLTHNAIAKRLGIHPEQVNRVCAELITHCVISECGHRLTEDGKQAPGPKPKPSSATETQVEELLRENPQQSNRQILAEVGLSDNHHRVVERVRDRLEGAGAIPPAPARAGRDGTVRHVPQAAPPPPVAAPTPQPAIGNDESSGALDQMVTLFRGLAGKTKRQLVARLLRELSDEDRAEVFSEVIR